jgi:outer membrane lipoprotein-sorting protein
MLSKYKSVIYIGILVFVVLSMVACGKAKLETVNLSEILAQAASVTEVKYQHKMTSQSLSTGTSAEIWLKGSKWRTELPLGQGYFVDTEAKTCFTWYPPENVLREAAYAAAGLDVLDYVSEIGWAKFIAESNPELIGTKTIDDKPSLLVEFTYEFESEQETLNGKAWIWKEKPFILRLEMTTGDNDPLIMEFKNIDFGDIPDSIFERP